MALLLAFLILLPFTQRGIAKQYQYGVMEHVYQVRIHQGLVAKNWHGGLASTPYCYNIGRVIYASLQSAATKNYSPYQQMLVVDCSQYVDLPRHLQENLIVEVDWKTAKTTGWNGENHTNAFVWWTNETWR